jgi:hypothetical protein
MKYTPTERIGVSHVEQIFTRDFGWIFRDQPISDMGIDSHIEIVENSSATGTLLALQIKTGESYFIKHGSDFVYYIDDDHYEYWLSHSLPVFLVMHNPVDRLTLWQAVNERTTERLEKSWKLIVPSKNVLSPIAKQDFIRAGPSGEYAKRSLQLRLHLPLIKAIAASQKVILETNEWLHKSLNRGSIRISIDSKRGTKEAFTWPFISTLPIKTMIGKFFPWFSLSIDEEFYREYYDEMSVRHIFNVLPDPYPWRIRAAEYAEYRLQLSLSELGTAYLRVEDHLSKTM